MFAGIPVADIAAARGFYEGLTGREPDLVPNPTEAAWRLSADGWIVLIEDPARAGATLHTILVTDLDAALAEMRSRGIEAAPVEVLGGGTRQSIVTDPDGNRLKVGQAP